MESFKRAFELRDRVTQHDRFQIEGQYYGTVTDELEKSVKTFRQWATIYPREYLPHAYLAYFLRLDGEFQNAIDEAHKAIRLNPYQYQSVYNLMVAEMVLGRPEEAKAACDKARSRNVESADLRRGRYWVAFLERDREAMQQQLDWATASSESTGILSLEQAATESYFGRLKHSRELLAHAVAVSSHAGFVEAAARYKAEQAVTEAEVGNLREARQDASEAPTLGSNTENKAEIALALARAGDPGARDLAVQLSGNMTSNKLFREYTLACVQAAVALQRGEPVEAETLLNAARLYELNNALIPGGLYSAYLRGLAYLAADKGEEAAAEFQKIIDHPGIVLNNVWALSHISNSPVRR